MSLRLTITGAKAVQRSLQEARKDGERRMKEAVRETCKNIRRQAKRNLANRKGSTALAGNYTKETAKSIRMKVRGTSGRVTVGFPGHILEYGTDPFFPPPDQLKDWAASKLGDPRAAFPVARSIAETGIAPSPFLRPAADKEDKPHRRRVNQALYGITGVTRG